MVAVARPSEASPARRADALRFLAALLVVAAPLAGLVFLLSLAVVRPFSTDVVLVEEPPAWPKADPSDLVADFAPAGPVLRLGFVGDIMQHRAQAGSDFRASYEFVRPFVQSLDLAVGNLEFPVDPARPVGPPAGSVRFNGSEDHLDALAHAGFDVLSTANNHAFDHGLEGATATLAAIAERGLAAVGTGVTGTSDILTVIDLGGVRIGLAAYTMLPNYYEDAEGNPEYWSRDWAIHELNFSDWTAEYRAEGLALFEAHKRRSEAEAVDLLIALVHWGAEWHMQPDADQRLAAHDMIDAGFDLVVGGHSHVLNPPELYRGRLIAYSLGNFISDFAEFETRIGAVLEVSVVRTPSDDIAVVDFAYLPVLTDRDGHVVMPLRTELTGEQQEAWAFARRIVGPSVRPFEDPAKRISSSRNPSAADAGVDDAGE